MVKVGIFVLRIKKWGNGLALATITKLYRYLKMKKKKFEIMLGNRLSMMLESELLSIELIINILNN